MKSEEAVKSEGKKTRKKQPNSLEEVSEKDSKRKRRKVEGTSDTGEVRNVANEADGVERVLTTDVSLSIEKRKKDRDRTHVDMGLEEKTDHTVKRKVKKDSEILEQEVKKKKKKKQKKNVANLGAPDQDEDIGLQEHHLHGVVKETADREEEDNNKKKKKKKKEKKKKQTNPDSREVELAPEVSDEQHATVDSTWKLELKKERSKRKRKRHETGAVEDKGKETRDSVHSPRHVEGTSAHVGKTVEKGEGEKERKKKKKRKRSKTSASLEDEGLVNDDGVHSDDVQKKEDGDKKKKKKTKSKKTSAEVCEPSRNPRKSAKKVKFSDQVEVFPSDDSVGNGLVQGKRFTPEEDELVKEAVLDYIDNHNLGEKGLEMLMNSSRHRELRGCWAEIRETLPWRPLPAVYYRAHILFERGEKRKWTQEELDLVKEYHNKKGACWKSLAIELGKHRFHVKDTFRRINVSNMKTGSWSQEELEKLYELVNMDLRMKAFAEKKVKHGMLKDNISWGAISEKLTTRSFANCCTKWYKCLTSSMVAEGCWADTDDYRLLMALYDIDETCEEDVDWDNLLDHRSGDLCSKRWKEMTRHIGDNQKRSFAEQVDVLYGRYCPDILEAKEAYNNRTPIDL